MHPTGGMRFYVLNSQKSAMMYVTCPRKLAPFRRRPRLHTVVGPLCLLDGHKISPSSQTICSMYSNVLVHEKIQNKVSRKTKQKTRGDSSEQTADGPRGHALYAEEDCS